MEIFDLLESAIKDILEQSIPGEEESKILLNCCLALESLSKAETNRVRTAMLTSDQEVIERDYLRSQQARTHEQFLKQVDAIWQNDKSGEYK